MEHSTDRAHCREQDRRRSSRPRRFLGPAPDPLPLLEEIRDRHESVKRETTEASVRAAVRGTPEDRSRSRLVKDADGNWQRVWQWSEADKATLKQRWEAGDDVNDIARDLATTAKACRVMAARLGAKRPENYRAKNLRGRG